MRFVDEQCINAQFIEVKDVVFAAVVQLFHPRFQPFLGLLELLDRHFVAAAGFANRLFERVDLLLEAASDQFRLVRNHIERGMGHHNDIPIPGCYPAHEVFAFAPFEVPLVGDQHFGVGIKRHHALAELLERGVLNDNQALMRQLQAFQFLRQSNHRVGFPGSDTVSDQSVAVLQTARHHLALMVHELELFAVHDPGGPRIMRQVRQIVMTGDKDVHLLVKRILGQFGDLRSGHHEVVVQLFELGPVLPRDDAGVVIHDRFIFGVFLIDRDIGKVQGAFQNVDGVGIADLKRGDAVPLRSLHAPLVGELVVPYLNRNFKFSRSPSFDHLRRHPRTLQRESDPVDVLPPGTDFFQSGHVAPQIRVKFRFPFRDFQLLHHIAGEVAARRFDIAVFRILIEAFGGKQLLFRLFHILADQFGDKRQIDFPAIIQAHRRGIRSGSRALRFFRLEHGTLGEDIALVVNDFVSDAVFSDFGGPVFQTGDTQVVRVLPQDRVGTRIADMSVLPDMLIVGALQFVLPFANLGIGAVLRHGLDGPVKGSGQIDETADFPLVTFGNHLVAVHLPDRLSILHHIDDVVPDEMFAFAKFFRSIFDGLRLKVRFNGTGDIFRQPGDRLFQFGGRVLPRSGRQGRHIFPVHAAGIGQGAEQHFRVPGVIFIDFDIAGVIAGRNADRIPERFSGKVAVPLFAEDHDIGHHLRSGIFQKRIVRQPDCSDQVGTFGHPLPRLSGNGIVQCAVARHRDDQAAGFHRVDGAGEEIVVQAQTRIAGIIRAVLTERKVSDHHIQRIVGDSGLFQTAYRHIRGGIEFLQNAAGYGIQFHRAEFRLIRQRIRDQSEEMPHAGAELPDFPAVESEALRQFPHRGNDRTLRIVRIDGACSGRRQLFRREQLRNLLMETVSRLEYVGQAAPADILRKNLLLFRGGRAVVTLQLFQEFDRGDIRFGLADVAARNQHVIRGDAMVGQLRKSSSSYSGKFSLHSSRRCFISGSVYVASSPSPVGAIRVS